MAYQRAARRAYERQQRIIWITGDQDHAEEGQDLYTIPGTAIRGIAHWYNDRTQIDGGGGLGTGWGAGWLNPSDTSFASHYALGECYEAIIWLADVDAYAVSAQWYNTDAAYLFPNLYFGHGAPASQHGDLYVVLFTELETYDDGLGNYADRLRTSYYNTLNTIRGLTLPAGQRVSVGLGFGGYNWSNATPVIDLSFWEEAINRSDFTCAQHMQDSVNLSLMEPQIRHATAQLGSYGKPVMVSHFELWGDVHPTAENAWGSFVAATLNNDAWMAARKRDGLFCFSLMQEPNVDSVAYQPMFNDARRAMRRHGAVSTRMPAWHTPHFIGLRPLERTFDSTVQGWASYDGLGTTTVDTAVKYMGAGSLKHTRTWGTGNQTITLGEGPWAPLDFTGGAGNPNGLTFAMWAKVDPGLAGIRVRIGNTWNNAGSDATSVGDWHQLRPDRWTQVLVTHSASVVANLKQPFMEFNHPAAPGTSQSVWIDNWAQGRMVS